MGNKLENTMWDSPFTPCVMPCTKEQWNNILLPILDKIEGAFVVGSMFTEHHYVTNNYAGVKWLFGETTLGNIKHPRIFVEEFSLLTFLHLSGINVVIGGNKANADKIKQWWNDRGWNVNPLHCSQNDRYCGIINGTFDWGMDLTLPKGTHIINPFEGGEVSGSKSKGVEKTEYNLSNIVKMAGLDISKIVIKLNQ